MLSNVNDCLKKIFIKNHGNDYKISWRRNGCSSAANIRFDEFNGKVSLESQIISSNYFE